MDVIPDAATRWQSMSLSKPRHQTQNLKVFILANISHYFFNILIFLADLSSLLRDSTVIEEEERQGSSSDSSTCLVGTTTQGLDGTAPQKGEIFNVEKGRMFCAETKKMYRFSVWLLRLWSAIIHREASGLWVSEQRSFVNIVQRCSSCYGNIFSLHYCWRWLEVSDWVGFGESSP